MSANKENWYKVIKESGEFDFKYYLFTYPDVRKANLDPIWHYINNGVEEGRNPNASFDTKYYLSEYEDIKLSGINPFFHYLSNGREEGRKAASVNHEEKRFYYEAVQKSGLFDENYYVEQYPDLQESSLDLLVHYLDYGVYEGRNPNSDFDTNYYLNTHADVKNAGINPLVHYVLQGLKEGRKTNPDSKKRLSSTLQSIELVKIQENTDHFVSYKKHEKINTKLKTIAFYLPQFHPFPENDEWWGKGFTEWTNVTKAKPNFIGHYQPHLPIHNGFYDLRVPEVMIEQAKLAKNYGIHGFNFYYYWFDGKILMHKPFEVLLQHKEIDINFCITWANENWTRRWDGQENDILIAQNHSDEDSIKFLEGLYKYFKDERYIRIDNKPVLIIYRADIIPKMKETVDLWRRKAREAGFDGLYLICSQTFGIKSPELFGFDAAMEFPPHNIPYQPITDSKTITNIEFDGLVFDYPNIVNHFCSLEEQEYKVFKTTMLSWDNTARKQNHSTVFDNFSIEYYKKWMKNQYEAILNNSKYNDNEKIVFVNAWNEWAEGTHLEPDRKFGYAYLEATYQALNSLSNSKKKIIIVSHDACCMGAQYLALNIAKNLKNVFKYNVEIVLFGPGDLVSEFEKIGNVNHVYDLDETKQKELYLNLYNNGFVKAIANTSVVGNVVENLANSNIKVVTLIHEMSQVIKSRDLFSSLNKIYENSGLVVFPNLTVKEDINSVFNINNEITKILPQGLFRQNTYKFNKADARNKLCDELGIELSSKIVLNIAYGDYRKGVDLFSEIASIAIVKDKSLHFVWVGDIEYFLNEDIKNKFINDENKKHIHFLGHKTDIGHYYAGSDLFFLTSREDPFPSVVLEAMDCALPVVAFKNAGGFSEIIKDKELLLDINNIEFASDFIIDFLASEAGKSIGINNQKLIESDFQFNTYIFNLLSLLNEDLKKVSVIVPCYNHEKYIAERLYSILNQTYLPYEIIFLDDCSSDKSVFVAEEILAKSNTKIPYQVIVNDINSGSPFKQWKKGIELAKGEFVWIAEGDDSCTDNFLSTLVPYFKDQFVNIAYAKTEMMNEKSEINAGFFDDYLNTASPGKFDSSYIKTGNKEIDEQLGVLNTLINASGLVIRKSSFGGNIDHAQNYKMCGDWLIYLECLINGKIAYDTSATNYFRRHSASQVAKTEGSAAYFKERNEISEYVISNFKVSMELIDRANIIIDKEWERFKHLHPDTDLNEVYDKQKLIKIFHEKKQLPSLAVIASDFSPGGGQLFAIRLANAWKSIGGNVVLLNVDKHHRNDEVIKKIDINVPWFNVKDISLSDVVDVFSIDVIHSSIWWADKYVLENIDKINKPVKWILTMHGCYESLLENPHWDSDFDDYLPRMLKKVDEWVYTAEKNKKIFESHTYPARLTKVLNGYEPEIPVKIQRKDLGIEQASLLLCLASRAIESKGWYEAVRAVNDLNSNGYNIELLLIGEGDAAADLKDKFGEKKHLHFLGQVSNLSDYIAISDIGILPTSFVGESMPLVLIEFMAQGKPIISTDIGEIRSMISDDIGSAGIILEVISGKIVFEKFANSIIELYQNEDKLSEYSKHSKRLFEMFRMEKMINKYKELYL